MTGAFLRSELVTLNPVDVNFANWVQLAGIRFVQGAAGVTLYLRWRSLRKTWRPWRCFGHLEAGGRKISSLDHGIIGGRPPVPKWNPGDEAYEQVRHWLDERPGDLSLRLGIYDPDLNVRCAILASTLPVADESTAVVIEPNRAPESHYVMRFDPAPLVPCGLRFAEGLELTAYSFVQRGSWLWARFKWTLRGRPRRRLRVFAHAVGEPEREAPTLAQFDEEIALRPRGPATEIEQNLVRNIRAPWIRAGVCTEPDLIRLPIEGGPAGFDAEERCFFAATTSPAPSTDKPLPGW